MKIPSPTCHQTLVLFWSIFLAPRIVGSLEDNSLTMVPTRGSLGILRPDLCRARVVCRDPCGVGRLTVLAYSRYSPFGLSSFSAATSCGRSGLLRSPDVCKSHLYCRWYSWCSCYSATYLFSCKPKERLRKSWLARRPSSQKENAIKRVAGDSQL